ncbi:MAG: hypothetical protein KY429_08930 [Actinobacteria bacterium]|nr:hypothetical protein [Actinomycetota bacterium]
MKDPYTLAVVEVLLRQTRATPIQALAKDFLSKYPTPRSLAIGPQSQLEADLLPFGLNVQRAEQLRALGESLGDQSFPKKLEAILRLPGVGPYAASAISCFIFGRAVPVIDVNIARIVQRVFGVEIIKGEPRKNKEVAQLAQQLLDGKQPRRINWALLDLGALVCTQRRPKCSQCPLLRSCSYAELLECAA